MRSAYSTPSTRFPVKSKEFPVFASFEDALSAMKEDAKAVRKRSAKLHHATPVHEKPSKMQEQALMCLKGVMLTKEVGDLIGGKNAAGFLSSLCTKGFVERQGTQGGVTKWRRTRKGRKWVERNRGAGK